MIMDKIIFSFQVSENHFVLNYFVEPHPVQAGWMEIEGKVT